MIRHHDTDVASSRHAQQRAGAITRYPRARRRHGGCSSPGAMKHAFACMVLVACATATEPDAPVRQASDAEIVSADANGTPTFLRGTLAVASDADAVPRVMRAMGLGATQLDVVESHADAVGGMHVRYAPLIDGLRVIGGDVQLHINAAGIVYAASRALPLDPPSGTARLSAEDARRRVAGATTAPELVYVVTSDAHELHRAWLVEDVGLRDGAAYRDRVFVDAVSGDIVDRHALIQPVRARRVHDAGHATGLPGVIAMVEDDAPSADPAVAAAYAHTGTAYDCYQALFARDGIDGGTLVASVHYGASVANAFWTGSQLVFGDGDGVDFSDLAQGFDVVTHELTHGVTQHTAGLVYANEPGALNEAFSDIMAARCEAWRLHDEQAAAVWQLGEDVFTPSTAGDALRYLDDPAADGGSYDYYPERYRGAGDYGGVHSNSGIANLAFYLVAAGGSHPRGKTSVVVPESRSYT